MKKLRKFKPFACLMLTAALLFGLIPAPFLNAQEARAEIALPSGPTEGAFGDSLTWTLTPDTEAEWDLEQGEPYRLTLSGSGEMPNLEALSAPPWSGHRDYITSLVLSEGITSIGDNVFCNSSSLTSVQLPSTLTVIGNRAFTSCLSLARVSLPDSVTKIGERAFESCKSLTSVQCGSGLLEIANCAFQSTALSDIQLQEGLKRIGKWAFCSCPLTGIDLPDSVASIDEYAFYSSNLTAFQVPKSATSIGTQFLGQCNQLAQITVAEGNASFQAIDGALYEMTDHAPYRVICFPAALRKDSLTIADGTQVIDEGAFRNAQIPSILFPETLRQIIGSAFYSCQITSLTLPDSLEFIGSEAFAFCGQMTSAYIGKNVNCIESAAFRGCGKLAELTVSEENAWLEAENGVLYSKGKTELLLYLIPNPSTEFHVPDTVTKIYGFAFSEINSLQELYLPRGLSQLETYGIHYNRKLKSIYFAGDAPSISSKNCIMGNAANLLLYRVKDSTGWDGWTAFTFAEWDPNEALTEEGTVGNFSWKYEGFNGRLTLSGNGPMPEFAETAESMADSIPWHPYLSGIQTVEANGVTSVSSYAFCQAGRLLRLDTAGALDAVGNFSFQGCGALKYINIAPVISIGEDAFAGDASLQDTLLLEHAASIGARAFQGCSSLSYVTLGGRLPSLEEEVFAGCSALSGLMLPESVAAIGPGALKGCSSLRSINIPAAVERIGKEAFADMTALEKAYFYGAYPIAIDELSFLSHSPSLTLYFRTAQPGWDSLGGSLFGLPVIGLDRFYTERRDHYSFRNSAASFGYGNDYRMPRQRYVDVLDSIPSGTYYYAINKSWGGSCYGMASSTLAFYENSLSLSDFVLEAENVFGMTAPQAPGSRLTKLIEGYQISQYQPHISSCGGALQRNMENYKGLIQKIEEFERSGGLATDPNASPIVIAAYACFGAHALVPVSIRQTETGEFEIQVYDCNKPTGLQTLTVNKALDGFSYGAYSKALSFVDYTDIARGMDGITLHSNEPDASLYLSVDREGVSVTNSDGKGPDEIEGAYEQKPFQAAEEDVFGGIRSFVLPKGEYTVTAADPQKEEAAQSGEVEGDMTFYLATEDIFAEITTPDEDTMLHIDTLESQAGELMIALTPGESEQSDEAAEITLVSKDGTERDIEVGGREATLQINTNEESIVITAPNGSEILIDGAKAEQAAEGVHVSFKSEPNENPLKLDGLQASVSCDAENRLNGTVTADLICGSKEPLAGILKAEYFDQDGRLVASCSKNQSFQAGLNFAALSIEGLSAAFSQTEGDVALTCKLTASNASGSFTASKTVTGIAVSLTKQEEPEQPGQPEKPVTPDQPGKPDQPENPDDTEQPDDKPITPANPDDTEQPDDKPDQPENPDEPEKPDQPELPDKPITPSTPDEPERPVTPDEPDKPVTPSTPDKPDKPVTPSTPDEPDKPVTPPTPDKPDKPDKPNDKPEIPSIDPPDPEKDPNAVQSIKLSPSKVTIGVGESFQIKAEISPATAKSQALTYVPSNSRIRVNASGKVTGVTAGDAWVIVKSANQVKKAMRIEVKKAPKKITLNAKKKKLKKGKSFQLKVKLPRGTASYRLTFSSNKKSVAKVSPTGKIKAKKKGKAVITAKTYNGKKAKITITVK